MNFLAHIYLSGDNDLLKIGNFMADGIRGKDYLRFPEEVKKGILLHRKIDSFTDEHLIYRKSKHRLHAKYGHYAGVIMNIIYDHFLAKNWERYSNESLANYVNDFYQLLDDHFGILTEKTKNLLPYMKHNNWLIYVKNIKQTCLPAPIIPKQKLHRPEAAFEVRKALVIVDVNANLFTQMPKISGPTMPSYLHIITMLFFV